MTNKPQLRPQQRNSRFTMLALLLIFVAPILLAVYLQSGFSDYEPMTTTNHGLLLDPPVHVNGWKDQSNAMGRPLWTLLVYSQSACAASCIEHFSWLQQLQLALGRHQDQLQLEWLGIAPDAEQQQQFDKLGVERAHLLEQQEPIAIAAELAADLESGQHWQTLLIDPHGYMVLRYEQKADITGMRKDIDRLIRQSNKALGLN